MTPGDALVQSLLVSPLLVGDLPNADRFDRALLGSPDFVSELNFDQKLGHLYEDAMASLLIASPRVELVEKNLQLQRDRHSTVGELDFFCLLYTSPSPRDRG